MIIRFTNVIIFVNSAIFQKNADSGFVPVSEYLQKGFLFYGSSKDIFS